MEGLFYNGMANRDANKIIETGVYWTNLYGAENPQNFPLEFKMGYVIVIAYQDGNIAQEIRNSTGGPILKRFKTKSGEWTPWQ